MKAKQIVMWIFVGAFLLYGGLAHADSINLTQLVGVTASQSSDYSGCGPGYDIGAGQAIDNNTNGNLNEFWSVSHTEIENNPWWEVDLGNMYNIDKIVIWNRTDANPNYLTNFTVSILNGDNDEVWSETYFQSGDGYPNPSFSIDFSTAVKLGQKVRITLNDKNCLHLAEVQVFGDSNSVPIPGAVWLLGSGLIGLAGIRRKLKRRQ